MGDTARLSIRIGAYMKQALRDIRDEENASIISESGPYRIDDRYGSAGNLIQGGITVSGLVQRALWNHVLWCRENGRMSDGAWERYKDGFGAFYRGPDGDGLESDPKQMEATDITVNSRLSDDDDAAQEAVAKLAMLKDDDLD